MNTPPDSNAEPIAADHPGAARFRLRIGHVLAAALGLGLLGWGVLFLLFKLALAALR